MKINFIFSPQYNNVLDPHFVVPKNLKNIIEKMESFWEEEGSAIEKILFQNTGKKFGAKEIPCYLNTVLSLSDPLSLKIESLDDMKDNLIHELMHVFITQNYLSIKKEWDTFYTKKFQTESALTRTHLMIHSLHYVIAEKIMPGRINRIKTYSVMFDYVRSWEIVEMTNPKEIIKLVFKK